MILNKLYSCYNININYTTTNYITLFDNKWMSDEIENKII